MENITDRPRLRRSPSTSSGSCAVSASAPSAAIKSSILLIWLLHVQPLVPLAGGPGVHSPPFTLGRLGRVGIPGQQDHCQHGVCAARIADHTDPHPLMLAGAGTSEQASGS